MTEQYAFEQFTAVRNYSDLSFSPDGQWVTYICNTTGQMNVWKQPVHLNNGQIGAPLQLTSLTESSARRAIWSPDGRIILTIADKSGSENYQIYGVPADTGWLYPLTHNHEVGYEIAQLPFSPDGRFISYASNERDRENVDVVLMDLSDGQSRIVLQGNGAFEPINWSPNGRYLLGLEASSNMNTDLYLIDLKSGQYRLLTPHDGDVRYEPAGWHPDSSGFYLRCDQGREFMGLAFYRLSDSSFSWLATPDWDVEAVAVSHDGGQIVWRVNENGFSSLYLRDADKGSIERLEGLPVGVYNDLTFSPTESLLGFYVHRPVGPGELYMLDLESGQHWQLSQAYLGGVPADDMIEPELISYRSFDDRQIPALLFRPRNVPDSQKVPVLLSIHGGPEAQERPTYAYNGLYQYLLNRGVAILAPNIRGSSGYGKSYQRLIKRDWGGGDLKDLEHAALYLRSQDWVAADKLGVFGASYGGFATLSCITRLPQYWAAAVDIVGPSNMVTFTASVPEFWKRYIKEWIGDPDEDREMLVERSPISYVENVTAPLLVMQGANDPRVVKGESEQMVARLQELEREVDYLLFEDEGHGFTKASNMHKAMRASADWLLKHLQ